MLPSAAATCRQNRTGSLSAVSSDSQATGRPLRRAQSASNAVFPNPAGAHIPRARHGLVPRPRLVDRLTEAVAGELTVVCAPAGFGKTALLADWALHPWHA